MGHGCKTHVCDLLSNWIQLESRIEWEMVFKRVRRGEEKG